MAKVAAKAIEEDPKDRDVLRQLAEKSGELDPAMRAYAKRLAVKEQIRLKIWQPLGRLLGVSRDYFEFEFADDMADRLSDVPEEELVTPRGSIAGPAILGLGFSVEEPELRAMYLNLLATASDRRVEQSAHPSFAEIIRQLSAAEAAELASLLAAARDQHPIVELRLKGATADEPSKEGTSLLATHVLNWYEDGEPITAPERAMFVDNWIRLGLVTVDYGTYFVHSGAYSWVETTPLLVEARSSMTRQGFQPSSKAAPCDHRLGRRFTE